MASRGRVKFTINHAGVQDFLSHDGGIIALMQGKGSAVEAAVNSRNIRPKDGKPLPVRKTSGLSTWPGHQDRYAVMVTIAHPAALPIEAKHGLLSGATTAAGMEWGRKSKKWGSR